MGTNTYQCTDCPETFRLHSELRLHIQKHFLEKKHGEANIIVMAEEDREADSVVVEEPIQEIEIEIQS